jgi:hypothetical protein
LLVNAMTARLWVLGIGNVQVAANRAAFGVRGDHAVLRHHPDAPIGDRGV